MPASTAFAVLHSVLGTALLILGWVALAARKSARSRHPRVGTVYFWTLAVSAATGIGGGLLLHANSLTVVEVVTVPTFALGLLGYLAARRRRPWLGQPWLSWHILGQSGSYVLVVIVFVLQTVARAFPSISLVTGLAWGVPLGVGALLVTRTLRRWLPAGGRFAGPAAQID